MKRTLSSGLQRFERDIDQLRFNLGQHDHAGVELPVAGCAAPLRRITSEGILEWVQLV